MNDAVEILLIEDNPDDVTLTINAFEAHKLANHTHVARDGAEALDYIFCRGAYSTRDANQRPRVILLDLNLPKISGLDVLRQIKADPRTSMIPVVVLTSSKHDRDVVESYRLGVNSYIAKPVDFDQFIDAARILGMYWLLLNRPATTDVPA